MGGGAYTAGNEPTQQNYKTDQNVLYDLSIASTLGGGEVERHAVMADGDHHPGSGGALEGLPKDSDRPTNQRGMRRVDASYYYEQLGEERHGGSWWSHSQQKHRTQPVQVGSLLFHA